MLQLIIGGAGSGKSTRLTEKIAADVASGTPAWLIIPEQQANLSERTILPKLPTTAGLSFRITGFSGLAREVMSKCGGAHAAPPSGISLLLLWQNLRELQGLLQEYHTASPRSDAHLSVLLRRTLEELRICAITPTALEIAARQLPEDTMLRRKLNDLALLYASHQNTLAQIYDGDATDELALLCEILKKNDYFSGGHIYIDSFTSFTAEEYAVLRALLKSAAQVTLTLATDEHLAYQPSHDSIDQTHQRLLRLCEQDHIPVQTEYLSENHRTNSPMLRTLERSLWDLSVRQESLLPLSEQDSSDPITLLRCSNIYAEAEATALHILDLIHHGTRYGDIAVVVRDTEAYRGVLDAALERYGIPYYFSEKTTLSVSALSRLLLSALRAVARAFPAQEIMALLKTGLCPVDAADVDRFEQYISTWKLTGAAFTAPVWTRNPDGYGNEGRMSARAQDILDAANRVRETIMTPLLRLHSRTTGERPVPALCEALYDFMCELKLYEGCAARAEKELSRGYLKEAGETLRVFETVTSALQDMSRYLPDAEADLESFITALSLLFDATEIASVPSLHDSVTIGSADTLRVEDVAVSFVLGLCEGEFPKAVSEEGLLSEAEKQQLALLGLELEHSGELRASNELLFVWRAMTKPSSRLFASTLLSATDGKSKTPSVAYERLLFLFPALKSRIRTFDLSMIAPPPCNQCEQADTPPDASGEDDGLYQSVSPSAEDLSPAVLSRCFGDTLWLTQSRIQTFVLCPYSYYCTYFLSPRERQAARIDADDSGNFLHYILEQFLRRCLDMEGNFHLPAPDTVEPLADALVNGYLREGVGVGADEYRTLHIFRRLRALTLMLVRDILNELSHSRFRPRAFELRIDGRDPTAPSPYEIELSDGHRIRLGGTVDRVDFYRRGDEIYLRVIDYKSSARDIALSDIRRGLGLQLLIYLFTLCRPENIHPAGALYVATSEADGMPRAARSGLLIDDRDLLLAMNDECDPTYLAGITEKKDGSLSGRALTDTDTLLALESDIRETLRRIGQDMLSGRARRTPSPDACRYCTVKDACPEAVRE